MGGRRAVLSHPLAAPIAIVGTWRGHEGHGYFRSVGFSRSLLTAPQTVRSLMGPSEEGQDRSNLFRLYILLQRKRFIYFSYDYINILPPSKKNVNLVFREVKQFQLCPNLYNIVLIYVLQHKYL